MKSIAFFNNKGGVGKTVLAYHLAWMFSEQGERVLAVDLDPQANLSAMFLDEEALETIWQGKRRQTIDGDISPLFDGTGDIAENPHIETVDGRIGLLPGDLALSRREDELSAQWPRCVDGEARAFRVTTVFARLIARACQTFQADRALIDVGPNLGAINRAALIASDHVVMPLAPDLFSLQGLRNVGPTLRDWRRQWQERLAKRPEDLNLTLPAGDMQPLGYVLMRHAVHLSRPVRAFARWMDRVPAEYREAVLDDSKSEAPAIDADEHCLARLKDYRSLMPLAQEANKPMFKLKPADGVIGAQQRAVQGCYLEFKALYQQIQGRLA